MTCGAGSASTPGPPLLSAGTTHPTTTGSLPDTGKQEGGPTGPGEAKVTALDGGINTVHTCTLPLVSASLCVTHVQWTFLVV